MMLTRQTDVHVKGTIPIVLPQGAPRMAKRRSAQNQANGSDAVSYGMFFSLPTCLLGKVLSLLMEVDLKVAGVLLSAGKKEEIKGNREGTWSEVVNRMKCALRMIKKMSVWVSVKSAEEAWLATSEMFEERIGEIALYDNWESKWTKERKGEGSKIKIKKITIICFVPDIGMERIRGRGNGKIGRGPMGYDNKRRKGMLGGTETFLRMLKQNGGLATEELKVVSLSERNIADDTESTWYGSCSRNGETATAWALASFFTGLCSQFMIHNNGPQRLHVVNCKVMKHKSSGALMGYAKDATNVGRIMHTVCHTDDDVKLDRTPHLHQELLNLHAFEKHRDGIADGVIGPVGCEFGLSSGLRREPVLRMSSGGVKTTIVAETLRLTLERKNRKLDRVMLWKCIPLGYARKVIEDQSGCDYLPLDVGHDFANANDYNNEMPRVYDDACSVEWRNDGDNSTSMRIYELYLI